MSLRGLQNDLLELNDRIFRETKFRTEQFAINFVDFLVDESPVDTSNLISNYQVSVGTPASDVVLPHVPGFAGSTRNASGTITRLEAQFELAGRRVGQTIFVTNNVDYLEALNSNTQRSDNGFLERSFEMAIVKTESMPFRLT